jgi:hypothetical protein
MKTSFIRIRWLFLWLRLQPRLFRCFSGTSPGGIVTFRNARHGHIAQIQTAGLGLFSTAEAERNSARHHIEDVLARAVPPERRLVKSECGRGFNYTPKFSALLKNLEELLSTQ